MEFGANKSTKSLRDCGLGIRVKNWHPCRTEFSPSPAERAEGAGGRGPHGGQDAAFRAAMLGSSPRRRTSCFCCRGAAVSTAEAHPRARTDRPTPAVRLKCSGAETNAPPLRISFPGKPFLLHLTPFFPTEMLILCPDCGREVSDAAPACPHCGRPILPRPAAQQPVPAAAPPKPIAGIVVACVFGVLTLLWARGHAENPANEDT